MPKRLGHLMVGIAALAVALAVLRDPFGQLLLLFTLAVAGGIGLALLGDFTDRWLRSRHAAWADLLWVMLVPVWLILFLSLTIILIGLFFVIATWDSASV